MTLLHWNINLLTDLTHLWPIFRTSSVAKSSTWLWPRLRVRSLVASKSGPNLGALSQKIYVPVYYGFLNSPLRSVACILRRQRFQSGTGSN